jgi:hypothetical protein
MRRADAMAKQSSWVISHIPEAWTAMPSGRARVEQGIGASDEFLVERSETNLEGGYRGERARTVYLRKPAFAECCVRLQAT